MSVVVAFSAPGGLPGFSSPKVANSDLEVRAPLLRMKRGNPTARRNGSFTACCFIFVAPSSNLTGQP